MLCCTVTQKKRGEIKYAKRIKRHSKLRQQCGFNGSAKKDYQMSAEFEGASGVTKIQVGRIWSKTLVVASVIGILLVLILSYALTNLI